jgi:hypothetical protein
VVDTQSRAHPHPRRVHRHSRANQRVDNTGAVVPCTVWLSSPHPPTATRPASVATSARGPASLGTSASHAAAPRGVPVGAVGRVLAVFAPLVSVVEVCSADDLGDPPPGELSAHTGPADNFAGVGGRTGGTDLLVVEQGCRPAEGGFGSGVAARLGAGGLLAVLTHLDRRDGRVGDPTGSVVAAAQYADLLYLQHIVLTTETTSPNPPTLVATSALEPECAYCRVRPMVVNLLLFAQPAAARPTVPAQLAPAVRAAIHPAGHPATPTAGRLHPGSPAKDPRPPADASPLSDGEQEVLW